VRRGAAKAAIVVGDEYRQPVISGCDAGDIGKAQVLHQPVLQSAEGALHAAFGLRDVGADDVDVQLGQRAGGLGDAITVGVRGFDKIRTIEPGTIADNKRLTEALAQVQAQQAAYGSNLRRFHPARQRPPNNLEAPGKPTRGRPSREVLATATE